MADKETGKAIATGVLVGGIIVGLAKLLEALTKPVGAAPPGVQIVKPDDETRQAIASIIALLADIGVKLDILSPKLSAIENNTAELDLTNSLLADIKAILAGEPVPTEAKYNFRVADTEQNLLIAGNSEKELYRATAPDKGALLRIKLVSDSADIRYDLYIDNRRWQFNVADMLDESIELPHFPGAWLEKATGTEFVFMFSGGESMLMRYWDSFRLVARTTTATAVTIASGEVAEKVMI